MASIARAAVPFGVLIGLAVGFAATSWVSCLIADAREAATPSLSPEEKLAMRNWDGWIVVLGVIVGPMAGFVVALLVKERLARSRLRADKLH